MRDNQLITFKGHHQLNRGQLMLFNTRDVNFRKINKEGLSFVYPLIEEWKCHTFKKDDYLFPCGDPYPSILKDIASINFPSLTCL